MVIFHWKWWDFPCFILYLSQHCPLIFPMWWLGNSVGSSNWLPTVHRLGNICWEYMWNILGIFVGNLDIPRSLALSSPLAIEIAWFWAWKPAEALNEARLFAQQRCFLGWGGFRAGARKVPKVRALVRPGWQTFHAQKLHGAGIFTYICAIFVG